jgi:acetolactate synthase-1/3 small subunit
MTIVVEADALKLEQVKRQLGRLIDVIEVKEIKDEEFIGRDLLLALIQVDGEATKTELRTLVECFGAKFADEQDHAVVVEAVGKSKALDEFVEALRRFKLLRLVRAGRVALEKYN